MKYCYWTLNKNILLDPGNDLVSTDEEKAEVNNFFASDFTGNLSPCPS